MVAALYLLFILHLFSYALALELPRGVTLPEAFKCRNGVGEITWDKVNDDYCDCIDGSDEPGTSACNNGVFHCRDVSYKMVSIHSSLVNDGICDCCDGSDEYNGLISCTNTCGALAAAVEETRSLKRTEFEEGHRKYKEFVRMLPTIMEEKRVQAEKAEQEKLAREAEMREQEKLRAAEEAERLREEEKLQAAMTEEEKQRQKEQEQPTSEEEKGEAETERQPDQQSHKDNTHLPEASQDDSGNPVDDPAADPTEVSGEDQNPDTHDDAAGAGHGDNQGHSEETTDFPQETATVAIDYGPGEGFRMLAYLEDCLDFSDHDYTYTLCPFKDVKQRSAATSYATSLGRWGNWESDGVNNYSVMMYTTGDGCWNGPNRSTKVHIHCGSENQLISVSEPSRCEYLMNVRTPAACYDEPEVLLARLHE